MKDLRGTGRTDLEVWNDIVDRLGDLSCLLDDLDLSLSLGRAARLLGHSDGDQLGKTLRSQSLPAFRLVKS